MENEWKWIIIIEIYRISWYDAHHLGFEDVSDSAPKIRLAPWLEHLHFLYPDANHGAGIFTYKTGSSLGGFMVNIPAPSIDDSQKIRDFQLQSWFPGITRWSLIFFCCGSSPPNPRLIRNFGQTWFKPSTVTYDLAVRKSGLVWT